MAARKKDTTTTIDEPITTTTKPVISKAMAFATDDEIVIASQTRAYKLTGLSPLLGSNPASESIRTQFIAAKEKARMIKLGKLTQAKLDEENEYYQDDDKGTTVFMRDPETGALVLSGHVILGLLKENLAIIGDQIGLKTPKSRVDRYLYCNDPFIPIMRDNATILDPDEDFERPLRADTMQGPRTTLASSERIFDPWEIRFELELLDNSGTAQSKPLTWGMIEAALKLGSHSGLGQWRKGGYGRFECERIE